MPRLDRDADADAAPEPVAAAEPVVVPVEPTGEKAPLHQRQPVAIAGVVATLPTVVYNLGDAFGWFTLTGMQKSAVDYAYSVLLIIVFWLLSGQVYAPANVIPVQAPVVATKP